jgi:hypothetical protein
MGHWLSVLGHHGHDNTVKRLTERCFSRIPFHRKESKPTRLCIVCNDHDKKKRLDSIIMAVMLLCA